MKSEVKKIMNFVATVRIKVLAKSFEYSKDGKKTYNKLTIMNGTDAGSVFVSDELFRDVDAGHDYDVHAQYKEGVSDHGKYAMFTLTSIINEVGDFGQTPKVAEKK